MRKPKSHAPSANQMPQIVKQGTGFKNSPAQGLVQKSYWHENGYDGNHVDPELYMTIAVVAWLFAATAKHMLWNWEIQTYCRSKGTQTSMFLWDSSSWRWQLATSNHDIWKWTCFQCFFWPSDRFYTTKTAFPSRFSLGNGKLPTYIVRWPSYFDLCCALPNMFFAVCHAKSPEVTVNVAKPPNMLFVSHCIIICIIIQLVLPFQDDSLLVPLYHYI